MMMGLVVCRHGDGINNNDGMEMSGVEWFSVCSVDCDIRLRGPVVAKVKR